MTLPSPSTTEALLAELAREPDGISLPRLCKRLGLRMSVLMRELAWLGEASIGGQPGAGLVRVERRGERSFAVLTGRGRSAPEDDGTELPP
ncbi:hypothetical protein GCM10022229_11650 [Luteimonas lutimaris]|uniref:ArsR family transcriptional regulator n=1 Tax=Luteimonas lutimaris TaxID=698645 RepID=A0ABP7MCG4_9GAMM